MGTRTEILKIAGQLKEIAAKNPSVGLMPIVAELEAAAERADKKRLNKKKAVEEFIQLRPRIQIIVPVPRPNFLGNVVAPRITDPTLKHQLAEYEKSVAAYVQHVERSDQAYTAALGVFKSRWDA